MKIPATINFNVTSQNGKSYAKIKNQNLQVDIGTFWLASNLQDIDSYFNTLIDATLNSNWKLLKVAINPIIKKYVGETIDALISPIVAKIPIQDFFQQNSTK